MKKNVLLWCVALPFIQLLAGCNTTSQSQCNSNSPCQFLPGLFQRTPTTVTKTDTTKNSVALNDGGAMKIDNQRVKDDRFLPRFSAGKTPSGVAKIATTKEPPLQEPLILNGTPKEAVSPAALPEVTKLPLPPPMTEVTPQPEISPPKVELSAPVKAGPTALQSAPSKQGAYADYTLLVGPVQEFRKTLRLRYAGVEQADPHGGSVVLEGGPELDALQDGQRVRVRGALIPAEDRLSGARFRVDAIEVLE